MVGGAGEPCFGISDDVSRKLYFILCDTGRGHFDVAGQTADYIALFLRKALEYRLSGHPSLNEPVRLKN